MDTMVRLIVSLLRQAAAHTARRMAVTAGLWALALGFVLMGMIGFAAAVWIWLAQILDPLSAALIVGAVNFLLAGITLMIARSKARSPGPFDTPLARELRETLFGRETNIDLWVPLIGLAVLGFLMGSKSRD